MKKFRCDICNVEVEKSYDLTDLHKEYKFDNIEHVCRDCEKEIDNVITKINTIYAEVKTNWIRKTIQRMFKTKQGI